MIASGDTMLTVFNSAVIVGGIALIAAVAGVAIYAVIAMDHDRSIIPWGLHNRIAAAKARTKIATEELEQEALEIRRLALVPHRQRVMQAVAEGKPVAELINNMGKDPVGEALRADRFGLERRDKGPNWV